jgi:hypothetical protein
MPDHSGLDTPTLMHPCSGYLRGCLPIGQGGEAGMEPREGKHASNPRGFSGKGIPPPRGALDPSRRPPGSSVLTLQVRCVGGAPAWAGASFRFPRSPPDFVQGMAQFAKCLQPSPRAFHLRAVQLLTPPPFSGAPGLFSATRPQGRSVFTARRVTLLVQVFDTKACIAQLDPKVGYASVMPYSRSEAPWRGDSHCLHSPRVLRRPRPPAQSVLPGGSTTARRVRTRWMPRPPPLAWHTTRALVTTVLPQLPPLNQHRSPHRRSLQALQVGIP